MENNASSIQWPPYELINGVPYITHIASNGNKYVTWKPRQAIPKAPNNIPSISVTPESSERNSSPVQTPGRAGKLADYTPGINETNTTGNSEMAKINTLGALLVFVGATFTLL